MKRKRAEESISIDIPDEELSEHEVVARVVNVSNNGRRVSQKPHVFYVPTSPERPVTQSRNEDNDELLPFTVDDQNNGDAGVQRHQIQPRSKRKNHYFVTTVSLIRSLAVPLSTDREIGT